MTDREIICIANLCYQEQGSVVGAAAEATLAINRYRAYGAKYDSLYEYMRYSGWWAKAIQWMDEGTCPDSAREAVENVINGMPTLPEYIDEHDCLSDISYLEVNETEYNGLRVYDKSLYVKDVTKIHNKYGAEYTFYCFPIEGADPFGYTKKPISNPIEGAVLWMEMLARDDSHGYDQEYRWGERGDYDCSSAVISAYEAAGVPLRSHGASYTGDMRMSFLECGFEDVTGLVDPVTGQGLVRGDVLLNEAHHTAMYIGDGLEAEASINENGGATGGEPGDQTGKEILIRAYRNFPWDCILRYRSQEVPEVKVGTVKIPFAYLEKGNRGDSVKILQALLNIISGSDLDIDGEFGSMTESALKKYQESIGAKASGRVNKATIRRFAESACITGW